MFRCCGSTLELDRYDITCSSLVMSTCTHINHIRLRDVFVSRLRRGCCSHRERTSCENSSWRVRRRSTIALIGNHLGKHYFAFSVHRQYIQTCIIHWIMAILICERAFKVHSEVFGSGSVPAAHVSPEGSSMASVWTSSRQRLKRRHKRLTFNKRNNQAFFIL